jgi:choline transport protein
MKSVGDVAVAQEPDDDSEAFAEEHDRYDQTRNDQKDMYRLGKQQELRRNFRFASLVGFSMILGNGWVYSLTGAITSLTNGGTAGGIWMYLIVIIGMSFSTLSMAEMASMAPTAGGQYHWVSEFAPREHQRFLSYLTGWLCV